MSATTLRFKHFWPQVIVANEKKAILRHDLIRRVLESALHVRILRRKSAWNTTGLQYQVIGWFEEALKPYRGRYKPVLLMDFARAHAAPSAFSAYLFARLLQREQSIHCCASGIVWLLQPLDTHVLRLREAKLMLSLLVPISSDMHGNKAAHSGCFLSQTVLRDPRGPARPHMVPRLRNLRLHIWTKRAE